MNILIDGYNLLFAVGIIDPNRSQADLEVARRALLNFLRQHLTSDEAARTTIVFDAGRAAPATALTEFQYAGMTVHFARDYEDADELIELLIRRDSVPKRLTVVSSDHRLQQAGRRRRARVVDSETWWDQLASRSDPQRSSTSEATPTERHGDRPLLAADVQSWLERFGRIDEREETVTSTPPESEAPPGDWSDVERSLLERAEAKPQPDRRRGSKKRR